MIESKVLPYTPADQVAEADPFGIRRQRPIRSVQVDTLIASQGRVVEAQKRVDRVEQLKLSESQAWSTFFGESIEVTEPPANLLQLLDFLEEQDIEHMEAHYLPPKEIYTKDQHSGLFHRNKYPGMHVGPSSRYRAMLDNGSLIKGAGKGPVKGELPGMWIVMDNYNRFKHDESTDPYAEIFKSLYSKGLLKDFPTSIGGKSHDLTGRQLNELVLPEIAEQWDIIPEWVRSISYLEYYILGNAFYPEWGKQSEAIWFSDMRLAQFNQRTFGGGAKRGSNGLSIFDVEEGLFRNPQQDIGVKPIIEFPA